VWKEGQSGEEQLPVDGMSRNAVFFSSPCHFNIRWAALVGTLVMTYRFLDTSLTFHTKTTLHACPRPLRLRQLQPPRELHLSLLHFRLQRKVDCLLCQVQYRLQECRQ
jgi:hypothetical protein